MKYKCGFDVASVIDQLATPLVLDVLPSILYKYEGADWYQRYVPPIMKKYKDYGRLYEKTITDYDLTAAWFLLFPFETVNGEFYRLEGAGVYFQKEKGLNEDQMRKLESMRTLRNSVAHGNAKMRFIAREHQHLFHIDEQIKELEEGESNVQAVVYDGDDPNDAQRILHADALDYIEDAFRALNPNVSKIVQEERERIMKRLLLMSDPLSGNIKRSKIHTQNYAQFQGMMQELRKQYSHIGNYPWTNAPIGEPIDLPLPWANRLNDLEDLPWPDLNAETEAEKKAEAEKKTQNDKSIVDEVVDKAFDTAYNLGKNIFNDFFGKKN
ncbi:MAG: hypothetical protein K5908_02485 [Erysipelotrichaceae bacterium]|nr:hypothetical protein [Erysipelotrichaceae bacterium]